MDRFYVNTVESPPRSSWVHPLGPAPPTPQPSPFAPPPGPPPPENRGYSPYPPQGGYNQGYGQPPPQQWGQSPPPQGSYYGSPPPQGGYPPYGGAPPQENRGGFYTYGLLGECEADRSSVRLVRIEHSSAPGVRSASAAEEVRSGNGYCTAGRCATWIDASACRMLIARVRWCGSGRWRATHGCVRGPRGS